MSKLEFPLKLQYNNIDTLRYMLTYFKEIHIHTIMHIRMKHYTREQSLALSQILCVMKSCSSEDLAIMPFYKSTLLQIHTSCQIIKLQNSVGYNANILSSRWADQYKGTHTPSLACTPHVFRLILNSKHMSHAKIPKHGQ